MGQSDREIIQKLLNGWTLKTLMEPDIISDPNELPHLENLTLRAVVIKDDIFWGYTLHHHLSITSIDYFLPSCQPPCLNSFLYSNFGEKNFFCNVVENLVDHQFTQSIAPLSRYRFHQWILVRDYEEIYDLKGLNSKAPVEDAIRKNDDLKCAFLTEDNFWHINNVHIPYFVYKTGKAYFQTEPFKMQPIFFSEDWIESVRADKDALLQRMEINGLKGALKFESPVAHAQYVIDLDGYFTDMDSQLKKQWAKIAELKVFKRRLPEGTERISY